MPRASDYRDPTPDPETGLTQAEKTAALMKLGAFGLDRDEIDALARAGIGLAKAGAVPRAVDGIEWCCARLQDGWKARDIPAVAVLAAKDRERIVAWGTAEREAGRHPVLSLGLRAIRALKGKS